VADEVFRLLEELWDEGLSPKSAPVRRAERLLHLLHGDRVDDADEDAA
jgi:hypothetical protein